MGKKDINVLVVEDNPGDRRLVSEMLRESSTHIFHVTPAGKLEEALKILSGKKPDIILLDMDLPDSHGVAGLEKIVSLDSSIPVIILTGTNDEQVAIKAAEKHAANYLVKGQINSGSLIRCVQYAIEIKRAEEILKRDKEMLEKLVNEKARELLRAQHEIDKAKRLSDIGALASTVAHELRNPLAVIAAVVYNLKRTIKDSKIEDGLITIRDKVSESDQIINNILSYSKITLSHLEDVKINDILKLCITEAKERFSGKNILINEKMNFTEDISIKASPVQIKEVFSNILNNAFDAINKDAGKIEIESKVNPSTVSILIKDNGEGISKENLNKVLDPFFTTKAKGTGLGLAVSNQIVILHDGSISIESEKGKGSTVTVTLPIRRSHK